MTILPKKKPTKDKNEGESNEHQMGHSGHSHQHHQSATDSRHEKATRSRNSPTRWLPSTTREEKLASHDPGGSFEGHEGATSQHKRRHRSSPHRNHVRKHRGHVQTPHTSAAPPSPPVDYGATNTEYEETGYNSEDEYVAPPSRPDNVNVDELEVRFEEALKEKKGWVIKKMGEDGACLFRAVADQVYGDQEMHGVIRKHCVDYMRKNSDYYSHYVTEDFTTYLNRKMTEHCHGNHVEIQAISEMFNRPVEVYQYSIEPINTFTCSYKTEDEPIRISYHRNVHYNSVVDPYKATIGVGLGLPGFQPGLADKNQMHDAVRQSEDTHIEQCMLEDKLKETDWEVTQESIEEQVARESYLQWLRDNEVSARRHNSTRSASATCSSSADSMYKDLGSPETKQGRSPRSRSNPASGQNSPQRVDSVDQNSPRPTGSGTNMSVSPLHFLGESSLVGATGGTSPKQPMVTDNPFSETSSLMNQFDPSFLGYGQWDEDDILAQVMAQSQQEYLDSLKKNAASSPSPSSLTFLQPPHASSSSSMTQDPNS
ncbi:hypothetical protein FSP39_001235 [Pinctada imbricata]|uniref:ubiquitinyl hydrolase 1 n=1 Tax=Pinctada imbricata TaxID=66713 RepID=A0AA88YLD0_PINIB|nr:hypothetical protein FSP39_001235 [Pinctada imbricata]